MAATSRLMVDVADVRSRAAKHFDTHFRRWATERFLEGREWGDTRAVVGERGDQVARLSIGLHPPTERQAIKVGKAAIGWAAEWRNSPVAHYASWFRKEWPRLGAQDVPERIVLKGAEAIAAFAG